MKMKVFPNELFYLFWYFSKNEKWEKLKEIQGDDFELPFNIYAPIYLRGIEYLLKEKLIKITEPLSFHGAHFSKEIKPKLMAVADARVKSLIQKNSFGYKDFFKIEDYFIKKVRSVDYRLFSSNLEDFLTNKLPTIKVDYKKIKLRLGNYVEKFLSHESVFVNHTSMNVTDYLTPELLSSKYKQQCIDECGPTQESLERCLKKETKSLYGMDVFDNPFLFLPSMYYLEMQGALEITNITASMDGWYWVDYKETAHKKRGQGIWKIECTKINSNNKFAIYINEQEGPTFVNIINKGYAKILYEIAKSGFFTKKERLDEKKTKDDITYLHKKLLNGFVKTKLVEFERYSQRVVPMNDVKIQIKR